MVSLEYALKSFTCYHFVIVC